MLGAARRHEVEQELGYFVDFDPFVVEVPEHRYFVRSLYFDDPSYSAFHEKHDGLHTRWKFRLRTYAEQPDTPAPTFLEMKGRIDNLVFKRRVPLPETEAERLRHEPVGDPLQLVHGVEGRVAEQFRFECLRKRLAPVALVDYRRRPYVSKYDAEFRLTFDEQLAGWSTDRLFPTPSARRRQLLPGACVVELKFRYHIPAWFHRILQSYELRRVSVSKICTALEGLEQVSAPA